MTNRDHEAQRRIRENTDLQANSIFLARIDEDADDNDIKATENATGDLPITITLKAYFIEVFNRLNASSARVIAYPVGGIGAVRDVHAILQTYNSRTNTWDYDRRSRLSLTETPYESGDIVLCAAPGAPERGCYILGLVTPSSGLFSPNIQGAHWDRAITPNDKVFTVGEAIDENEHVLPQLLLEGVTNIEYRITPDITQLGLEVITQREGSRFNIFSDREYVISGTPQIDHQTTHYRWTASWDTDKGQTSTSLDFTITINEPE